jgi:hypothetical protein
MRGTRAARSGAEAWRLMYDPWEGSRGCEGLARVSDDGLERVGGKSTQLRVDEVNALNASDVSANVPNFTRRDQPSNSLRVLKTTFELRIVYS